MIDVQVARAAIRYKSTLKIAHEAARGGSGREAAKLHAQAMLVNEIATLLVGAEVWDQAVTAAKPEVVA
jgi:hypothetical protein